MTTNYQDPGERQRIVRRVITEIPERIDRKICMLFMDGYSDKEIRRRLSISEPELESRKKEIRQRLLDAGIRLRKEE